MFQVVIIPNNSTSNVSLCYKKEDEAQRIFKMVREAREQKTDVFIGDDFSNELSVNGADISYCMFIDVAKSQWREWEQMQCVERTRAIVGKRSPILAA